MKIRYTPLRFLTRGFGGPAAALLGAGILTFPIIVDEIRKNLGRRPDDKTFEFDDDINVYKIAALLKEVNSRPLDNVLYNKMTKLIFERKIRISTELIESSAKKSEPYRIVIGEHRVLREQNE
jgi:hypothetical protein